jgi:hypothetical protein
LKVTYRLGDDASSADAADDECEETREREQVLFGNDSAGSKYESGTGDDISLTCQSDGAVENKKRT